MSLLLLLIGPEFREPEVLGLFGLHRPAVAGMIVTKYLGTDKVLAKDRRYWVLLVVIWVIGTVAFTHQVRPIGNALTRDGFL